MYMTKVNWVPPLQSLKCYISLHRMSLLQENRVSFLLLEEKKNGCTFYVGFEPPNI